MSRQSVHLGRLHLHKLFSLDVNSNMSPQRMSKLSFIKLVRDLTKLNALQIVNIVFLNEAGQISAELLSVLDIILRQIRNNNTPFGGIIFLCTIDHTQLAPIKENLSLSHCKYLVVLKCLDSNIQLEKMKI